MNLFHRIHHADPPFFYSSPERTNQTLAIDRALYLCHIFSSHYIDVRRGVFSWLQSATTEPDATKSYVLYLYVSFNN